MYAGTPFVLVIRTICPYGIKSAFSCNMQFIAYNLSFFSQVPPVEATAPKIVGESLEEVDLVQQGEVRSPLVTSRHFPSLPVTSRHLPSPPVTSRYLPSPPVTSRYLPSPPVTSRHLPSPPVTSRHLA
ncbi:unnamed protein product [Bemisia tabaci]|uniref:Uncharacterized protein n=1 Tax=Bemisia tabaci TaxID=7038 RepID=A0A9P0F0G5_BEMTA|nr:unnamed protein product [Bemisia tabaci]